MTRRYRMPFATNDPQRPGVRVPAHKMDLLKPNGVGWVMVAHDDTHATIDADVSDVVHAQLIACPDVEAL